MQSINLLPPDYSKQVQAKKRAAVSVAVLVAAVLAMFGIGRLIGNIQRDCNESNTILEGGLEDLRRTKSELASDLNSMNDLANKIQTIQMINRNRLWAFRLSQIAESVSDQIVLTRARIAPIAPPSNDSGKPADPALSAKADEPKNDAEPHRLVLMLEGYALSTTDISGFIAELNARRIFQRVTFKGSQSVELNQQQVNRFELECPILYEAEPSSIQHSNNGVKSASAAIPLPEGGS